MARLLWVLAYALALGAPSAAQAVTVRGAVWVNVNGAWKALPEVGLWALDAADTPVGYAVSDRSGRFSTMSLAAQDAGPPYTLVLTFLGDRVQITDLFGAPPLWRTPPLPAPSGGVIDAGSVWVPEGWGWGASQIYARILEAYDFFQAQTGRHAPGYGGRVRVIYPCYLHGGVPFSTEQSIHWPGSSTDWRSVAHEFGHRVRQAQDGSWDHFGEDVGRFGYLRNHSLGDVTNRGFAFNEGWAYLLQAIWDPELAVYLSAPASNPGGDDNEGNARAGPSGAVRFRDPREERAMSFADERLQKALADATLGYAALLERVQVDDPLHLGPRGFATQQSARHAAAVTALIGPQRLALAAAIQRAQLEKAGAPPKVAGKLDALIAGWQKRDQQLAQVWTARNDAAQPIPVNALPLALAMPAQIQPAHAQPPRAISAACIRNAKTGFVHFWSYNPQRDRGRYTISCDDGYRDVMTAQPYEFREDGWYYHGYDDAPKAQAAKSCRSEFAGLDAQGKPDGLRGASAPMPCK